MQNYRHALSVIRRLLKFVAVATGILFFLFGIVTWVVFEKKDEWLLSQLQTFANESQSGQLQINAIDLRIFTNFPDLTVEVDNLRYYEHHAASRSSTEKPILTVHRLLISLELIPLVEERINITELTAVNAELNILEYDSGALNITRALTSPVSQKPGRPNSILVGLQSIALTDVLVSWHSSGQVDSSVVFIRALNVDIEMLGEGTAINLESRSDVQSLHLNGIDFPNGSLALEANFLHTRESNLVRIQSSKLRYNQFSATASGTYAHEKDRELDLDIDASSNDLELLSMALKPEILKRNLDLLQEGDVYAKGKVHGQLKNQPALLDVQFGLKDLSLILPNNLGAFRRVGFDGYYSSGDSPDHSGAILELSNLKGQLPGGFLKGNFQLKNFSDPHLSYQLDAQMKVDCFDQVFNIDFINQLAGRVLIHANFTGPLRDFEQFTADTTRQSTITLDNLSFALSKTNKMVSGVSGIIKNRSHQTTIEQLAFTYGKNDVQLQSKVDNLVLYLLGRNADLAATGTLKSSGQFSTSEFLFDTLQNAVIQDRISDLSFDFQVKIQRLGKGDNLGLAFNIQNLSARFDKLPDITRLSVQGTFNRTDRTILVDFITSMSLQARELLTNDFLFDSLDTAQVQDRITDFAADLQGNASIKEVKGRPATIDIAFDIRKLNAKFDKLPDIKLLNSSGFFHKGDSEIKLNVKDFRAILPQGKINLSGDLNIPQLRLWEFSALVELDRFPWTYVTELAAEIQTDKEPNAKARPVKDMELVTAKLDLTANVITYPFDINRLKVRNSEVHLSLPDSSEISTRYIDLDIENLHFMHPQNSGAITGIKSLLGVIKLKELDCAGLNLSGIDMRASGKDNQLEFAFSLPAPTSKSERGRLALDISKTEPTYHLRFDAEDADLEHYVRKYYDHKFMEGDISYGLDLQSAGKSWASIQSKLSGTVEITGHSLQLFGIDIDDALTKYKKSQNFNLTDVGAVLVAGPVGLAVTKGSNFVSLATINFDSTRKSQITSLHTRWKVANQQLITEDVAFATRQNRVAFDGRIDFEKDSIPALTIFLLDKQGCSLMDQTLSGKLGKLQTGKLNVAKTLLGSVINFANAVVGKDCTPVYNGQVKPPPPVKPVGNRKVRSPR